uniref:hypothetical protein n=1 Tax=Parerythrobacter lutipelagi TaxID=1964208 RepID=UPI0010F78EC4|nr:hypothetical protein [Parerythrobacter lutipelagi]
MKTYFIKMAAAILAAGAVSGPAIAQEQPIALSGDVMVEKTVVDEAGISTIERVEPDVVVPGDRLIFSTDYSNSGSEAVTDFVVTNPLPSAVRLASDADAGLAVSVDGGASWGILAALTVAADDGSVRPATHADVTHVRWTLAEVAPGERGRVEYPAIIR